MTKPRISSYTWLRISKAIAVALLTLTVLVFVGAVGVSCGTWYANHNFKTVKEAFEFGKGCQVISLVFCTRDMPIGTLVTPDCLSTVYWWEPMYPQDAISKPSEVIGKKVVYGMQKNEMVMYHNVEKGSACMRGKP
ncbi:MAG: SAF domain-containing protein [Candidatus Obscuribacterales bacterium]